MGLEGKYHRAFPSSGSNGIPVGDKKEADLAPHRR